MQTAGSFGGSFGGSFLAKLSLFYVQFCPVVTLATEINLLHESAQQAAMTAVQYAAKCGEKLIQAKAHIKVGFCCLIKVWISSRVSELIEWFNSLASSPEKSGVF